MSNNPKAEPERESPDINNESPDKAEDVRKGPTVESFGFPLPSEHVPTMLVEDGPFRLNVNVPLTSQGGGVFAHPAPFRFRRLAVLSRVIGVPEPLYQNVNPLNRIEIWLRGSADPAVIFDNRDNRLLVTLTREPAVTVDESDTQLGRRHVHTHPGFGSGPFPIERIVVREREGGEVLFQNGSARDYVIVLFKQHE
jgi:hypothetical protein